MWQKGNKVFHDGLLLGSGMSFPGPDPIENAKDPRRRPLADSIPRQESPLHGL